MLGGVRGTDHTLPVQGGCQTGSLIHYLGEEEGSSAWRKDIEGIGEGGVPPFAELPPVAASRAEGKRWGVESVGVRWCGVRGSAGREGHFSVKEK